MTVTVWSVPTRLRPLASGMAQVAGHVLGDVPSPPLVGLLQGVPRPAALLQVKHFSRMIMGGIKGRGHVVLQNPVAVRTGCTCCRSSM